MGRLLAVGRAGVEASYVLSPAVDGAEAAMARAASVRLRGEARLLQPGNRFAHINLDAMLEASPDPVALGILVVVDVCTEYLIILEFEFPPSAQLRRRTRTAAIH